MTPRHDIKRRDGKLGLLDNVMLLATFTFAALLVCAYLAPHINPGKAWFFAMAGLVAPILYLFNMAAALWWIVRWRLMILIIPVAALLAGAGNVSLFFRPSISKKYAEAPERAMTVMSYNAMGFIKEGEKGNPVSTLERTAAFINKQNPDILCLQEFQVKDSEGRKRLDSLLGLPHSAVNFVLPNRGGGGWGLAIYSRYPILRSGHKAFEGSTNSMLWADLAIGRDTVRVFNNHLQTTSVNSDERTYISRPDLLYADTTREDRVRTIAAKLRRNYVIRARQADSIAPLIEASPYKVIVCGDFNDTPISYVYTRMRGKLSDSFVEKGRGMAGNTYRGLFNLFRIDYILHSPEFKAMSYSTPSGELSDHKPVVVGFEPGPR